MLLGVMLLARIYEAFPLTCPHWGAEMLIIAFITEPVDVRAILAHIGEPENLPKCSLWMARNRPRQSRDSGPLVPACQDRPM